jgi:AmmeMemoRadiSam system protein B
MSLVFAALVPHPPMLLPSIGREHAKLLDKTWQAYQKVAEALRAARPDVILIISPHQKMMDETFCINLSPGYETHFTEFGDFSPPRKFKTDSQLIERLRHDARLSGHTIALCNEEHLDYGCGVPLYFLVGDDPTTPVVPISTTRGPAKSHFAFGQSVKEVLMHSRERVAVICSGDLSHRHTSDSPGGYSARAKEFDELMVTNLTAGNTSPILQMDSTLVDEAHACGYRPICTLLGILDHMQYRPELIAHETPFGIGYATVLFHLNT